MENKIEIFQKGEDKLLQIQRLIGKNKWSDGDIGLLAGKMGDVLFYYELDRYYSSSKKCRKNLEFAQRILDDIFTQLESGMNNVDFSNGLSGIAFIINFLIVNKYEDGEIDDILSDADDRIFRYIAHASDIPIDIGYGILGFMTYLIPRVNSGIIDYADHEDFIFKRLLISLINHLAYVLKKDNTWVKEPPLFDITWPLPHILRLLANARKLNIYNYKIDKLIDFISDDALSIYPRHQSNRLSLLVGIKYLLTDGQNSKWKLYADTLYASVDLDHIIFSELKDKNLEIINGVSGIYWLAAEYNRLSSAKESFNVNHEKFIDRLSCSGYWNEFEKDNSYLKYNCSLLEGLTGIGLTLIQLLSQDAIK